MSKRRALISEKTPNDYTLRPDFESVWITAEPFSVYIRKTDEGVVVDIFPLGKEDDEAIASTYALSADAMDAEELEVEFTPYQG